MILLTGLEVNQTRPFNGGPFNKNIGATIIRMNVPTPLFKVKPLDCSDINGLSSSIDWRSMRNSRCKPSWPPFVPGASLGSANNDSRYNNGTIQRSAQEQLRWLTGELVPDLCDCGRRDNTKERRRERDSQRPSH
jgi:hypothetical protein